MKRKELIKRLTDAGCVFVRPGARHDMYMNPQTGKKASGSQAPLISVVKPPKHILTKGTQCRNYII